jgi:hypothetical protein
LTIVDLLRLAAACWAAGRKVSEILAAMPRGAGPGRGREEVGDDRPAFGKAIDEVAISQTQRSDGSE